MQEPAASLGSRPPLSAGQSYLERLGVLFMHEIRLTIVMELNMREMGVQQFYETIGGSSYASVRRHFLKLVESGWLRKVRTVATGRGRPEDLYRATEQALIDTETWSTLPVSIRDAFTVMLLEEMGTRIGEALEEGMADTRVDRVSAFKTLVMDESSWRRAHDAVERCFLALRQEQIDAKIRLEASKEKPLLMIVNLAAFEAPGDPQAHAKMALPKAMGASSSVPWTRRIGRVFSDRLDLAIVDELHYAAMTPTQLQATLGGPSSRAILRRCKRLSELGWAVSIETLTGGALHGANVSQFRAAAPNISESDIYQKVPRSVRRGPTWEAFRRFIATSVGAVGAGTFNNRTDRHLTMSPLLVDECGWTQVTKALKAFEGDLLRLEDELERRSRGKKFSGFPSAFLLSSFEAPQR